MIAIKFGIGLAALAAAGARAPAATGDRIDFVTHNAIQIRAGAKAIWPHIVSLDWKQGAKLVPTSRLRDAVGATFDSVESNGVTGHRVENVEMVPQHIRTIRLTAIDGSLIGYAAWTLMKRGRSTMVRYDVYCFPKAVESGGLSPAEIVAAKRRYLDENVRRFGKELAALKALVEAGR